MTADCAMEMRKGPCRSGAPVVVLLLLGVAHGVGLGAVVGCGMQERSLADSACARFELLRGEASTPSNIRLLFGLRGCDGTPLAGLGTEAFELVEDGVPVSRFESGREVVSRGEDADMVAMLLLDVSGSITDSGSLPELQRAARSFVERVAAEQRVAVYLFDGRRQPQRLAPFSRDTRALQHAIDSLSSYAPVDPSTNLNGAVVTSLQMLDALVGAEVGSDRQYASLVVFTDGVDQAGRVTDTRALEAVRASRHAVFSIGLGDEFDTEHLHAIGKSGYEFAQDSDGIVEAFDATAELVAREWKRFYLLGFCSPKRSGQHVLTVALRDRSGGLTFPFSADGFSSGCDPEQIVLEPDSN